MDEFDEILLNINPEQTVPPFTERIPRLQKGRSELELKNKAYNLKNPREICASMVQQGNDIWIYFVRPWYSKKSSVKGFWRNLKIFEGRMNPHFLNVQNDFKEGNEVSFTIVNPNNNGNFFTIRATCNTI